MRHLGHRNRVAFNAKLRHKLFVRKLGPAIRAAFVLEAFPAPALRPLFAPYMGTQRIVWSGRYVE